MVSSGEHVAQGSCFTILALCCSFHLLEDIVLNFIIQVIRASLHYYLSQFSVKQVKKSREAFAVKILVLMSSYTTSILRTLHN